MYFRLEEGLLEGLIFVKFEDLIKLDFIAIKINHLLGFDCWKVCYFEMKQNLWLFY